ncbi:uncharacterized protein E0L32_004462 [Thyridium curvatum]|uniref:Uncharacterized protein n=1 Tax=Thyridium curvatum TaxID=1093900 RepID=A0A507AZR0_9PEZI|nr:uncharacterized protein E0L32_004462 [Thyridium curvatum]TPX15482.1 hypothetical protein E0L32_004462 [Thyridium curvatum]
MQHHPPPIKLDPVPPARRIPLGGAHPSPPQVQPGHVRLDGPQQPPALGEPHAPDPLGEQVARPQDPARVQLALAKVLEDRLLRRGGEHAGLPQPAADALADAPQRRDEPRRAQDHGPDGRAEVLAEVERQDVAAARKVAQRRPARGHGLPQPRAVHVHGDAAARRGPGLERAQLRQRHHGPRGGGGVLDADHPRGRLVHVVGDDGVLLGVPGRQVPPVQGPHGLDHGAAQVRDAAGLPVHDVGARVDEDGVRRLREQRPERELVGHRPADHEGGRLVPAELGHPLLEERGRLIFGVDIVMQGCFGDGLEHAE